MTCHSTIMTTLLLCGLTILLSTQNKRKRIEVRVGVMAKRQCQVVIFRNQRNQRNRIINLLIYRYYFIYLHTYSVLEFVCLPWSEVCSARVTSLLLLLLLLL